MASDSSRAVAGVFTDKRGGIMYDETSYRLFSGASGRSYVEALDTFVTIYMEITIALLVVLLVVVVFLSISDFRKFNANKSICRRTDSMKRKSAIVSLSSASYEHISSSHGSIS